MEGRNLVRGRYEIQEVLKQSGPMVTYRVFDLLLGRDCALKTFREIPDAAAAVSFQKECAILARISHPNVIEVFDRGEMDGSASRPFFVMPFLSGLTLEELIAAESRRLTPACVVEFMSQVCRGMQAAHDSGAFHGDLRTGDILLMKDDSVKIIRLGGGLSADPADDVRCLGTICYEALAIRKPALSEPVRRLAGLNPTVPEALSSVIHRALDKDSTNGFGSAREFGEALVSALRSNTAPSASAERKIRGDGPLIASRVSSPPDVEPRQAAEMTQFFRLEGRSAVPFEPADLIAKPNAVAPETVVSPPPADRVPVNSPDLLDSAPGEFTKYFRNPADPVPATRPGGVELPSLRVHAETKVNPQQASPGATAGFTELFRAGSGEQTQAGENAPSGIRRVDGMTLAGEAAAHKSAPPPAVPDPFLPKGQDALFPETDSDSASGPGNYTRILQAPVAPRPARVTGTDMFLSPPSSSVPEGKLLPSQGPSEYSRIVNQPRRSGASHAPENQKPAAIGAARRGLWLALLFGALGFAAVILVLYFALKH